MRAIAHARELLETRDFKLLLISQWMSQAADGLAQAAFADALVLEPLIEGTPARILRLFALTLLPYSLLSPFLGVFVDRWRRRELMARANLVRAALLLTLPLWGAALPGDAALFAAVLALLGLGRLFLTTKSAVLPVVLDERHLLRANSLSGGGGMISALLGGIVGVGAVGLTAPEPAFVLAGAVYAAAALPAARISRPLAHPHRGKESLVQAAARVLGELAAGVVEIGRRARARLPLIGIFVLRTVGMIVSIAAVLVIKREFPEAGDRFGRLSASAVALGAAGAGALLAAASAPLLGRRVSKPGLIVLGYLISGAGVLSLGGIEHMPAVLALTGLGGFGGFITKVAVDAQVQEALPDAYRGRAFAFYDILYNLASVVAAIFVVLTQAFSLRGSFVAAGLATIAAAAVLGAAMKRAGMLSDISSPRD